MSIRSKPLTSIIIPSYKQYGFLEEAIFSVLKQTNEDRELLLINDSPDENDRDIVYKLSLLDDRINLIQNKQNQGIATSRNIGIQHSKGKFIAFLDHDDLWKENKLETQLEIIEKDTNIGIIGTQAMMVNKVGENIRPMKYYKDDKNIRKNALIKTPFLQSSILTHKEVFDVIGYYDKALSMCDDSDMFLRILMKFKGSNTSDILTKYRLHGENTSMLNRKAMQRLSLKKHLQNGKNFPYYKRILAKKVILSATPETLIEKRYTLKNKSRNFMTKT